MGASIGLLEVDMAEKLLFPASVSGFLLEVGDSFRRCIDFVLQIGVNYTRLVISGLM